MRESLCIVATSSYEVGFYEAGPKRLGFDAQLKLRGNFGVFRTHPAAIGAANKRHAQRGRAIGDWFRGTLLLLGFAGLSTMPRIVSRINVLNLPRASAV
jgi:hypothetical protein